MTVQATPNFVDFVGNDAQTSFPFTFRVDDVAWLSVDFTDDFNQFLINADQDNNPGGSVEYSVAPPSPGMGGPTSFRVIRATPQAQNIDYTRYNAFDSESHEDALDRLTMITQDLAQTIVDQVADLQSQITANNLLITTGLSPGHQHVLADIIDAIDFGMVPASTIEGSFLRWSIGTNNYVATEALLSFVDNSLFITEQAAALASGAARGQIWVRDDAPNSLMFTDDAGTDFVIGGTLFVGGYLQLDATNRVTGIDNAGANTSADDVVVIGSGAAAAMDEADFQGSIVIGSGALPLTATTRDPWLVIGYLACANVPTANFHDANTIVGTRALTAHTFANVQAVTAFGYQVALNKTSGSLAGSTLIGSEIGYQGFATANMANCVAIGRRVFGQLGTGGVQSTVAIGTEAGNSLDSAIRNVLIGEQCAENAGNLDESVIIGYSAHPLTGAQQRLIVIGSQIQGFSGDQSIGIGSFQNSTGTTPTDHNIFIGHSAGNDLGGVVSSLLLIEQPQGSTSGVVHPFIYGDLDRGNLALLSLADTTTDLESGARVLPGWALSVPSIPAGEGIFTLSGRGDDPTAAADAQNYIHLFCRTADNAFMVQFDGGERMGFFNDGTDSFFEGASGDDLFLRAGTANILAGINGGAAQIYHLASAAVMARTLAAASGGFEVNNTLTGAGFERVLTASDIGGSAGGTIYVLKFTGTNSSPSIVASNTAASGWSVSGGDQNGEVIVTHNLGLSDSHDLVILTGYDSGSDAGAQPEGVFIEDRGTNSFQVQVHDDVAGINHGFVMIMAIDVS